MVNYGNSHWLQILCQFSPPFLPCHEIWRSIPSSKAFSMFPMCLVVVSPGLNRWTHHRWSKQGWLRFKRRKMWNSPWNSPYLKLCYRQSAMVNTMSTSMLVYPRVYHVISPCPRLYVPVNPVWPGSCVGKVPWVNVWHPSNRNPNHIWLTNWE